LHDTGPSLRDPGLYAHGDPHALWRALRQSCPVYWHDRDGTDAFWVVTSYAEGRKVLCDWRSFTATKGNFLRPRLDIPVPEAGHMMAMSDPPRHDVYRSPAATLFTAREVARLEGRAREIIGGLLTKAVGAGQCDFVDIARQIPLALVGDKLGIAAEDIEYIASLAARAEGNSPDPLAHDAKQAHVELLMYYYQVIADCRGRRGDDLVSVLLQAQADGLGISDEEIILNCDHVLMASGDSVKDAIGSAVLALAEHPSQWQAIRSGDASIGEAVEEILRWAAPATHLLRTATNDISLGGAEIRAGDSVTVWLPAVNRDESSFPDGNELRLSRHPNRHLTFGAGVHSCLGAKVARLILRVLLEELTRIVADIKLTGQIERVASYVLGGPSSLPVELRPQR
jgi:cytochrome P450